MSAADSTSSYLRAAARGESVEIPERVAAAKARHGLLGRMQRAVAIAILASLAMAPLSHASISSARQDSAAKTAIADQRSKRSENEVMMAAEKFAPVMDNKACVVNSLLFADHMKREVPGEWVTQANIELNGVNGIDTHRVVFFKAGSKFYVFDQELGPIHLRGNFTGKDQQPDLQRLGAAAIATITRAYERGDPAYENYRIPKGDRLHYMHGIMDPSREAAVVNYGGNRVLVFKEGEKVGAYIPNVGTRQARIVKHVGMDVAVPHMLRELFKGDTLEVSVEKGSLSGPSEHAVAMHKLPAPAVPEAPPSPVVTAGIGVRDVDTQ